MLVLHRDSGQIEHSTIGRIDEYLRPNDLLIVNDTKVLPARLFGHKVNTGGSVEILLLEEIEPRHRNPQSALADSELCAARLGQAIRDPQFSSEWWAFYRGSGRAMPGIRLELGNGRIEAEILSPTEDGRIRIFVRSDRPLLEVLNEEGVAPLPPYIKRKPGDDRAVDRDRYQTVYAEKPGAVAAPTAGLHFSESLLSELEVKGIRRTAITLHVGPGTFRPVKAEDLVDHVMHSEYYRVSEETVAMVEHCRLVGGRVVAVGTTSVRAMETALTEQGELASTSGRSNLFIYPPYEFRAVDIVLTNFHLPRSTLLMMICAFVGQHAVNRGIERVLTAYQQAIDSEYRFYSYGDCMLIL